MAQYSLCYCNSYIAHGVDPCKLKFIQGKMRAHLQKCLISGACEEEVLDCSSMEWFCKNCVSTASYLLNLYSRRLCILQHCIHCLYILLLRYKLVNEYYLIHCSYEDFQVRGRETTIVVNSTEFRLGVTTGLFTR